MDGSSGRREMMKKYYKRKNSRIFVGTMAAAMLLFSYMPVQAGGDIFHGTSQEEVTEEMVNNEPPRDYVVDEAVHKKGMEDAYGSYFLKDGIQTVSIEIAEDNLNYLLQHASEEKYVMADGVTIGDTTLGYVGLRTKGNYTLWHSFADNPGSDRFSFTINFGKYIKKAEYGKKQNFYGVDKISFNNFFFDKSMMKEFFAFQLMEEMGLPTPRHGLARLYINGQYYGVYAMIEALDEPILERYLGVDDDELSGYLVKPTGTNLLYEDILEDDAPLWEYDWEKHEELQEMLPVAMEWVRKLNCLSEGKDFEGNKMDVNSPQYVALLEQVMDVDEALRYFATHSWLCQLDNMFTVRQNFGLYIDREGRSLLLPWDYDLSFGCYAPQEAEATANYEIEVMFHGVAKGADKIYMDFPLFYVIYQNEELLDRYKSYMGECSKIAALGGKVAHTGKVYEPGYFNSCIERMEQELYQAASEELAENVYYMNSIKQPGDVKKGLPNLAKIIAMRSAGVWEQLHGTGARVCGAGCDLSALGNAYRSGYSYTGLLTVVDAATGIFVTADYGEERVDGLKHAPVLSITQPDKEQELYAEIAKCLRAGKADLVKVYQMDTGPEPVSEYTLHMPLSYTEAVSEEEIHFYRYDRQSKEMTELVMTPEDGLYVGDVGAVDCIVLHRDRKENTAWMIAVVLGSIIGLLAIAWVVYWEKRAIKK